MKVSLFTAISVCNYNTIRNSAIVGEDDLQRKLNESRNDQNGDKKSLAEITNELLDDFEEGKEQSLLL